MADEARIQVRINSDEHNWGDVGHKVEDQTLPVDVSSLPLPPGAATSAKQDTQITLLQGIAGFVPSVYDYISLVYTGNNLTTVIFKTGGSGGSVVSTLTLEYSGNTFTSVTKT